VVFQPHRYTRFSCFWNEFLKSFDKAHKMYVCDVYSAGDKPIEGISSEKFASQLKSVDAQYVKGAMQDVAQEVVKDIAEGDIVLTMGAGDITKLGGIIIELAGK
jgi:UDP-N-acetylmuramate--alanine ligase